MEKNHTSKKLKGLTRDNFHGKSKENKYCQDLLEKFPGERKKEERTFEEIPGCSHHVRPQPENSRSKI